MRRLILRSFQSPGDVLMLTAAVRDLHLAHPGHFQTDVRTSAAALWENNPHLTPLCEGEAGVEILDMHYPAIHQSNQRPYHFLHGYPLYLEQQLGLPIPVTRFHGDVHLSEAEKAAPPPGVERGVPERFWIVVAGGKYDFTAKWWDPERFQRVVDHFRGRLVFVQCGERGHWHPRLRGVVDLVGATTLRDFVRLVYHADGVLCPVTFAMHLAAAMPTRPARPPLRACVVVAGGREPAHWEAYPGHQFLSTVGALPCCAVGGCWRSRCQPVGDGDEKDRRHLCELPVQLTPELRIARCMDLIRAEDVILAVERFHEGGALTYQPLGGPQSAGGVGPIPSNEEHSVEVSVRFEHGLGDACNFAHCIPLYLARGHRVAVQCTPDKALLFHAAGATVTARAEREHPWPHAPTPPPNAEEPWQGNKTGYAATVFPMPNVGTPAACWDELCGVRLTLDGEVTPAHRDKVEALLRDLPRPLLLLHTMANTGPDRKSLDAATTKELYRRLLARTDGTLILLDWDERVPRYRHYRLRHLTADLGRLTLPELYHLMTRSDLLIGVDSGPLHFARFTDLPTVGVWLRHYPAHYLLPRGRTVNVVAACHRDADRRLRPHYNTVLAPEGGSLAEFIAEQAVRVLAGPCYLGPEQIGADVQLQHFVGLTAGVVEHNGGFTDRSPTFHRALRHLRRCPNPVVIETGTIRAEEDWPGAGFSTYLFGAFLRRHGGTLHSVDLDPNHCAFARRWTGVFGSAVQVHRGDSHEFLRSFAEPIDLFYADSMDVGLPGFEAHCLREVELALPRLRAGGRVLIDDTVHGGGGWHGKGAWAVPWLLERGWVIECAGYQVLLRPGS